MNRVFLLIAGTRYVRAIRLTRCVPFVMKTLAVRIGTCQMSVYIQKLPTCLIILQLSFMPSLFLFGVGILSPFFGLDILSLTMLDMGRGARKPVFQVSDKVRFKPVSSFTESS